MGAVTGSYRRYDSRGAPATTGWDAWANDYATLGARDPVYALGKELLHEIVDEVAPPPRGREAWALDFNCGAGDDLARLLARGWHAVGCDGSTGMLHAAAARCPDELDTGRLELLHGRAEDLAPTSLGGRRFELVFSTTGGLAYLDDEAFVRVHELLARSLAPGGVLVIAHLTRFSAAESLFHLSRLHLRQALRRLRGRVPIEVRGERLLMRLRSPRHVRRLLDGVLDVERMAPLLVFTPPFHSGFAPGARVLAALRRLERRAMQVDALAALADQVVCVARVSSANRSR